MRPMWLLTVIFQMPGVSAISALDHPARHPSCARSCCLADRTNGPLVLVANMEDEASACYRAGAGSIGFAGNDFAMMPETSCIGVGPDPCGKVNARYTGRSTANHVLRP
jgi:hypothetical protein